MLDSLRQRIRLRAELEPFTEAELQDYLRHQVACAGGNYDRIFAPGTVAALFRYSQGVARLANTLCESALDIAAVQQQKQLTAELVTRTAVSLLGLAEAEPAASPAPARSRRRTRTGRRAASAHPSASHAAPAPSLPQRPSASCPPRPSRGALRRDPQRPRPRSRRSHARPSRRSGTAAPPVEPVPAKPSQPQSSPPPAPAAPPVAPRRGARPNPLELEFDGGATDVTDVAAHGLPGPNGRGRFPRGRATARQPAPGAAKGRPPPRRPRGTRARRSARTVADG